MAFRSCQPARSQSFASTTSALRVSTTGGSGATKAGPMLRAPMRPAAAPVMMQLAKAIRQPPPPPMPAAGRARLPGCHSNEWASCSGQANYGQMGRLS
jgi:hypothetical protein